MLTAATNSVKRPACAACLIKYREPPCLPRVSCLMTELACETQTKHISQKYSADRVYLTRASECLFSLAGLLRMGTAHGHRSQPMQWTVDTTFIAGIGHQTHGTCEPGKHLTLYSIHNQLNAMCNGYFITSTIFIGIGDSVCQIIIT